MAKPTHRKLPSSPRRDRVRSSRRVVLELGRDTALESRLLLSGDSTRTILTTSASSVSPGSSVTLTATVTDLTNTGTTPTGGNVTFMDGSTVLATATLTNGVASYSTASLSTGKHAIQASYGGVSSFAASNEGIGPSSTVTTVAGTGTSGYSGDGGQATAAQLSFPFAVATDASGDMFIADIDSDVIRKVTPGGVITTVAGNGSSSNSGDGGQATAAGLDEPLSVAVDSAGDLFIATDSNTIRKVTPSGVISTFAGNGVQGYSGDNGAATSAELSDPRGLATDSAGDLFFADESNNVIRKITPSGIITTVAGNGTYGYSGDGGAATSAKLYIPLGVTVDAAGDLFIADTYNHAIREVNTSGIITTVAGTGTAGYSGDGGAATSATLRYPEGVTLDAAGDLFIADTNNGVIREVTPNGVITTVAGTGSSGYSGDGGPASSAQFNAIYGVKVDAAGGLLVDDAGNNVIRRIGTSVNVTVGYPTFVLSGVPSTVTAGTAESLTVQVDNADGTLDTGYTGTVHFTSSDPQASLPADATLTNGTGTFSVKPKTAGTQSFTATDTTQPGTTGTESAITVTPAATAAYVFSGLVNEIAGGMESVTVRALDPYGNTNTASNVTLNITSSDAHATYPATVTLASGVRSFTFTPVTAGPQQLQVSDPGNASLTNSETIVVSPTAPTHFVVTGPVSDTAGSAETLTVTVEDQYGNVVTGYTGTIHFTSSDTQAGLPADATLTNGTRTFSVTPKTAGTESFTATDTVQPAITGTDAGVVVSPAPASHFAVTGASGGPAGSAETFTVVPLDDYGNVATGYNGTVHFTSSDPRAILPANTTISPGGESFTVTFATAGSDTITATDMVASNLTGTETGIVVTPASADHLVVTGPASGVAGVAETLFVTVEDVYGNVEAGYAGTIHFTSSDTQAVLPADATLRDGTGTFSVTPKTAGTLSFTATDTEQSEVTGTEGGVVITPSALASYVVAGATAAVAGTPGSVTVTAYDAYGNVETGDSGTIHFTSTDAQAVLPADATLTNGTGTFDATFKTAGSQAITATDTGSPTITATQSGIVITAATADHLVITGAATETTGAPDTLTITAEDPYGNTAADSDTINLTSTDPNATIPASVTLVSGVATFSVTPKTTGSQTVTGTDSTDSTVTGSVSSNVVSAVVDHFTVTGATGGTAGSVETFTVTAIDVYGNVAAGYTGTVHFTSSDTQAVLPADATLRDGTGTFSVTPKTAGTLSITATDTGSSAVLGAETAIAVTPAAAAQFVITGPSTTIAGQSQTYAIIARDAFGNLATGYAGTVHFTSTDPNAVLPTSLTLAGGSGSFTATLNSSGSQSITATDTVTPSLTGSIPTIATTAEISGTVYLDANANGTFDAGDSVLAGRVVYLDLNGSGVFVTGDPTATTDASGHFAFPGYAVGSATVLEDSSQDMSYRYTLDHTTTLTDGSLTIGVVPFSPISPYPVVTTPATTATGPAGFVQGLYRTILGRTGGDSEIQGWLDRMTAGMTMPQVAASIINSVEHRTEEVATYYSEFLHRATDPGSVIWVDDLLAGASGEDVTEGIIASPEYQSAHTDPSLLIHDLYLDVLGRAGTDSEVAGWQTALNSGLTTTQLVANFVQSPEANDQIVDSLYMTALHRTREVGTSDIWSEMLAAGATPSQVAVGILTSPEFVKNTEGTTTT